MPPDADLEAARRALEGTEVTSVRLAELTHEGAKLELKAAMEAGGDREAREAELREHAQGALRAAGALAANDQAPQPAAHRCPSTLSAMSARSRRRHRRTSRKRNPFLLALVILGRPLRSW